MPDTTPAAEPTTPPAAPAEASPAAEPEPEDLEPELAHANAFSSLTIDEKVKHLKARQDWIVRQLAKAKA